MENMLGSICIYTFNFHFAKVLNIGIFVILTVTMMAVITMIMIKKNGFEDNCYNDDAISDSTSKFFLVSALFGEKLRKKNSISIIRRWWRIRISGRRHSHKYTLYPFFSFSLSSLILLIVWFIHSSIQYTHFRHKWGVRIT